MSFVRLNEDEEDEQRVSGSAEDASQTLGDEREREADSTVVEMSTMASLETSTQTEPPQKKLLSTTNGDEESGGYPLDTLESSSSLPKGILARHFIENLACYIPIGVAILCAAVIITVGFLVGGPEIDFSPSKPCVECFQGSPDEFGLVPMSFYPFSEKQTVKRNDRFQYNGSPG